MESEDTRRLRQRLADAELAHRSAVEQGVRTERRLEEVLESRTWRAQSAVARALGSPGRLLRLPVDLWRALTAPPGPPPAPTASIDQPLRPEERDAFLEASAGKPRLLVVTPWLSIGGAEKVVLDVLDGLGDAVAVALVTTKPADHAWEPRFRERTPWIFHGARRRPGDSAGFVVDLARELGVEGALISSTDEGYAALAGLKQADVRWIADIIHSDAPTGWMSRSVAEDRRFALHFAVGERQARSLVEAGVAPEKTVVARNGADVEALSRPRFAEERRALRAELGLDDQTPLTAFVGRISLEKGPLLLLETLERLPGARAVFVGDGPQRFSLERRIRDAGLGERVHTAGMSGRPEAWLAAVDVLVIPSRDEGLPLVLLDAMAMGLPVVASDVGAISEAIEHGVSGYVIAERTPKAFAEALGPLLRDPALRERMGDAARSRAERELSLTGTKQVYREAILRGLGA